MNLTSPTANKFTWSDIVSARPAASTELRPGERAWIVGLSAEEERSGYFLEKFPTGWVYTIEFEDGSSVSAAEADLILLWRAEQSKLLDAREEKKREETNEAFIRSLVERVPDLKPLLEKHLKDERGEMLPMTFVLFDVTRYFVDLVNSGDPQSLLTAAAMLQFFEEYYDEEQKSEAGVSGIIQISFMETLWMEGLATQEIADMLGPRLKKGWQYLQEVIERGNKSE